MAKPVTKVEIFFNLEDLPVAAFLLDDSTQGVLDNTIYKLAGADWFDVTPWVQDVTINRGKSRLLDRYESGKAQVRFNNSTRQFDPKYTGSIFFGGILPRLKVRVSANDNYIFQGSIDDWNIDYNPAGPSFATITCSDDLVFLNQRSLSARTNTVQLSGTRISTLLSLPEIDWTGPTNIETGSTMLQADTIAEGTNLLQYFQTIEMTEQGSLFVSRDGVLNFQDRNSYNLSNLLFADDGTGINYENITVVYGTELMYNQVDANRIGGLTYQANDTASQQLFGTLNLTFTDTLHNSDDDVIDMISYVVNNYSDPEYRFETISVNLNKQTLSNQNNILTVDFDTLIQVKFTPSKLPPAIEQYAQIIGVEHQISQTEHKTTFKLGGILYMSFVLDNTTFGVLDSNALAY